MCVYRYYLDERIREEIELELISYRVICGSGTYTSKTWISSYAMEIGTAYNPFLKPQDTFKGCNKDLYDRKNGFPGTEPNPIL